MEPIHDELNRPAPPVPGPAAWPRYSPWGDGAYVDMDVPLEQEFGPEWFAILLEGGS